MRFSIIIPSYKTKFLEDAIKSVIQQTCVDWELIIVDDCSPEDIKSIVDSFSSDTRIKYYRNASNYGVEILVDNWNKCLEYCQGDYVLCMGDDDMLLPCCLEDYSKLIDRYPEVNVYHMRSQMVDEYGNIKKMLEERPEYESAVEMMTAQWTNHRLQFIGDFMFSHNWLIKNGGYVKFPMAYSSDWATANKAALDGNGIANCNTYGFQYRDNSLTISRTQNLRKTLLATVLVRDWYDNLTKDIDARLNELTSNSLKQNIRDMIYHMIETKPTTSNISFCLSNATYLGLAKITIINLCLRAIIKHYFNK